MTVVNEASDIALLSRACPLHGSVQVTPVGGATWIVHVSGNVDWTTSRQLRANFIELIRSFRPTRIILDLAGVTHMDSSGIGALVASLHDSRQERTGFVLAALNSPLRRLLQRTQLHTVFDIRATVQDALRA